MDGESIYVVSFRHNGEDRIIDSVWDTELGAHHTATSLEQVTDAIVEVQRFNLNQESDT